MAKKTIISERDAFLEFFGTGACFWTSEDGSRTDLVLVRDPVEQFDSEIHARQKLFAEFMWLKGVDWSQRMARAFVDWLPMEKEWFDGGGPRPRNPSAWQFVEKSEYPVWRLKI